MWKRCKYWHIFVGCMQLVGKLVAPDFLQKRLEQSESDLIDQE